MKDVIKRHSTCMACDFFHPNIGGVESHIYQLSQCLIERGHKVIVITHAYSDRTGVRYLTSGLKVYYLPVLPFYNQCVLPTVFGTLAVVRDILIREKISIVHGHSAFSTLGHEVMLHARTMNIRAVFTDHSLFGFATLDSIITNKVLSFSLAGVNHVICVSHTCKENTVLRSSVPPEMVSVIPNAVDSTVFTPDVSKRTPGRIKIVVISRLVYRKGMDLLAALLPVVCNHHQDVDFIIGGDGPKRVLLEEVRERHELMARVAMLGTVEHSNVRNVLVQGDIFLNTSLTEAFCIAIVEAACCGLQVVSTRVGGVPEVLPSDLVHLAEPSASDIVQALDRAIDAHRKGILPHPEAVHSRVKQFYTWQSVAAHTENVYNSITVEDDFTFTERLQRYGKQCGPIASKIIVIVATINLLLLMFLQWLRPAKNIDIACDWPEKLTDRGPSSSSKADTKKRGNYQNLPSQPKHERKGSENMQTSEELWKWDSHMLQTDREDVLLTQARYRTLPHKPDDSC